MKRLYLIRGLPGSGKTELAMRLTDYHVAADHFLCNCTTRSPQLYADALQWCLQRVEDLMKEQVEWRESVVAVHNTFLRIEYMGPYMRLAHKHHYSVSVIECKSQFGSVHNVSQSTLAAMAKEWEPYHITVQ